MCETPFTYHPFGNSTPPHTHTQALLPIPSCWLWLTKAPLCVPAHSLDRSLCARYRAKARIRKSSLSRYRGGDRNVTRQLLYHRINVWSGAIGAGERSKRGWGVGCVDQGRLPVGTTRNQKLGEQPGIRAAIGPPGAFVWMRARCPSVTRGRFVQDARLSRRRVSCSLLCLSARCPIGLPREPGDSPCIILS